MSIHRKFALGIAAVSFLFFFKKQKDIADSPAGGNAPKQDNNY